MKTENIKKTLDDIQSGDKVLAVSKYVKRIIQVTRTTPTLIVCGASKYRKSDGEKVPFDPWCSEYIQILTPELKAKFLQQVRLANNIKLIQSTNWSEIPCEVVNQIVDLIKQYQK